MRALKPTSAFEPTAKQALQFESVARVPTSQLAFTTVAGLQS
jgi:hypothetical protein